MTERFGIPGCPQYFEVVGLAMIAFARLEWNAVYCCERLDPPYIAFIEAQKKTAGHIGADLESLFGRVEDQSLKSKCIPLAKAFRLLVGERNALVHGHPITAANGEQLLKKGRKIWTVSAVNSFAGDCVLAGKPLNALLYEELCRENSVTLTT